MFDFSNSLLIVSLFDVFVASVGSVKGRLAVAGRKRVEHSCAEISKRAPSSQLEVLFESVSPVSG